jgi:hypothetical protein
MNLTKYQKQQGKNWKTAMITLSKDHPIVLYCKSWTITQAFDDYQKMLIRDPKYVKSRLSFI